VVAEHAAIDGVHLAEFIHVDEKYAAPEHVLQTGAGGLEYGLQVPEALLGLTLDVGAGQMIRRRIDRSLSRDEHQSLEAHGGRVGAEWPGRVVGRDRKVSGHGVSVGCEVWR
jgi:hypothetical protein